MSSFDLGETVICSIEIKDDTGAYKSPATSTNIVITQTAPTYAVKVTSTGMTNDSVGKFHYDCQSTGYAAGSYQVTYTATDGARITIQNDTFILEQR